MAVGRVVSKQEVSEFEASLGHATRSCLQTNTELAVGLTLGKLLSCRWSSHKHGGGPACRMDAICADFRKHVFNHIPLVSGHKLAEVSTLSLIGRVGLRP